MVRMVLLGRTGNHLFQYAFGRVLAARRGEELELDASWFDGGSWREVAPWLGLPLRAKVVRKWPWLNRGLLKLSGRHRWEFCGLPVMKEPTDDQRFRPEFFDWPGDCVVFGYFQTPRYFEPLERELREEYERLFERVGPLGDRLDEIAVHVRRTDYLRHPAFQVCGEGYYRRAVARARERSGVERVAVYSDDPGWCREFFAGDRAVEIRERSVGCWGDLEDLVRMARAKHLVMANSSYSWWAAWLGRWAGQVVMMPDRWYAGEVVAPIEEKKMTGWELVETKSDVYGV